MAAHMEFPSPQITVLALKDILENLGIAPIVLKHWKIEIEEVPAKWCYAITLSWRTYRIRKIIDKNELTLSKTNALMATGRLIASQLYTLNAAEDEEHMEALLLLHRKPTLDGIHNA